MINLILGGVTLVLEGRSWMAESSNEPTRASAAVRAAEALSGHLQPDGYEPDEEAWLARAVAQLLGGEVEPRAVAEVEEGFVY